MAEISNTQIDRLGERLKEGIISDDDLRLLDNYRRSFAEGYEITVVPGQIYMQYMLLRFAITVGLCNSLP